MPEINPTILAGMEQVIALMEHYRALLEARGFTRWAAEAMVIHYHHNICAEIDRVASLRFQAAQHAGAEEARL